MMPLAQPFQAKTLHQRVSDSTHISDVPAMDNRPHAHLDGCWTG
jgi:hypothetical protein